jgi:hypothetical protein
VNLPDIPERVRYLIVGVRDRTGQPVQTVFAYKSGREWFWGADYDRAEHFSDLSEARARFRYLTGASKLRLTRDIRLVKVTFSPRIEVLAPAPDAVTRLAAIAAGMEKSPPPAVS